MIFFGFFLIPLIIALVGYWISKEISGKELAIIIAALAACAGISVAICYYGNTTDVEAWNGVVTAKQRNTVSCSHSYQCNCYESCTGSGKDRSCSQVCSTCYEHNHDYDWDVYTSNGETITIEREDRQGVNQPIRWTRVTIGEPTSVSHKFENFIKGAPGTLFRKTGQMDRFKGSIPSYPKVYDYYHLDRLIDPSGSVRDSRAWNEQLSQINAKLGHSKQVNAMVLVTTQPREYYFALEQAWIGGKKNDAVLVVGVDSEMKPIWTEVMAWVSDESFRINLKEEILNLPRLEREATLSVLEKHISLNFKRKPMHDFEYLKASIVPTTTQWIVSLLIGSMLAIGLTFLFHNVDPFEDRFSRPRYNYSSHRRWR